jgi:esterase/lipase
MRRWGAWLVLVAAIVVWCAPARGQQMSVAEYQKKSAKAGKQQQKNLQKQAKQQAKAQQKAQKAQAKQLKQARKADAKANRQLHP